MKNIHRTSIIGDNVKIGSNVSIGPYCVIEGNISIGDNTVFQSHIVVKNNVEIGNNCYFMPFCSIGQSPQTYENELFNDAEVIIGNNNRFYESVTVSLGTKDGGMKTIIGNDNLFMLSSHIGHDSIIGDGNIFANNVAIAGHVQIANNVTIGGNAAVHQFVRIGDLVMIGGLAGITHHISPFCMVMRTNDNELSGLNLIGMRRNGYDNKQIRDAKIIYQILSSSDDLVDKIKQVESGNGLDIKVKNTIISFIKENDRRGFLPFNFN